MGPLIYLNDETKMPLGTRRAVHHQYVGRAAGAAVEPRDGRLDLAHLADDPGLLPGSAVSVRDGHQRRECGSQVSSVSLSSQGVVVDGKPAVVLCASLFYFRLPREQWRARLEQVRASGYTCVDVYLPWNFHELSPGRWSFEGRRDVAAFLDLAAEVGLHGHRPARAVHLLRMGRRRAAGLARARPRAARSGRTSRASSRR